MERVRSPRQLRVIATGEPERVYLCHCRPASAALARLSISARPPGVRCGSRANPKSSSVASGSNIRFYFCPNCGSNLWESDRNPLGCGVAGGAFVENLPPPTSSV